MWMILSSPNMKTDDSYKKSKTLCLKKLISIKSCLNTGAFLSATCCYRAKSSVMESLLKLADKLGLGGTKLRLSQVV